MQRAKWLLFAIATALVTTGVLVELASVGLIYRIVPGDPGRVHTAPRAPSCRAWYTENLYVDQSRPQRQTWEVSCAEALALPGRDGWVENELGMRIRYRHFATSPAEEASESRPIWLHVPGMTGNILDGARYLPIARRLGFRLVVLELSNHGISDNSGEGAGWGCREHWDVVAVVSALAGEAPRAEFLVSATSMGTMAVLNALPILGARGLADRIVMLALEDPIPSLELLLSQHLPGLLAEAIAARVASRIQLDLEACAPLRVLEILRTPTLVQHAVGDPSVTMHLVQGFYRTIPETTLKQLRYYPKGGHAQAMNADPQRFQRDLASFWRLGKQGRPDSEPSGPDRLGAGLEPPAEGSRRIEGEPDGRGDQRVDHPT